MLSYRAVAEFLGGLAHVARAAALYREIVDAPAGYLSVADMIAAVLAAVEEADLFPVHAYDTYDIHQALVEGDLPPLQYFVHFEGLDLDDEWEFYGEPVHLVMALMEGCGNGEAFEHVYSDDACAWWAERQGEYDLPDLNALDAGRVTENLKTLGGMPWNGLWAIWRWIEGGTGNWFVDIPCSCSGELDLGLDWTVEDVRMLQREYAAAGEIFGPFAELQDLCRRAPDITLSHCFDLALEGSRRAADDLEEVDAEEVIL